MYIVFSFTNNSNNSYDNLDLVYEYSVIFIFNSLLSHRNIECLHVFETLLLPDVILKVGFLAIKLLTTSF